MFIRAISSAKLQSNHHHQQTNIQFYYKPDAFLSSNRVKALAAQDINPIAYVPGLRLPNFAPRPGFVPRPVCLSGQQARI